MVSPFLPCYRSGDHRMTRKPRTCVATVQAVRRHPRAANVRKATVGGGAFKAGLRGGDNSNSRKQPAETMLAQDGKHFTSAASARPDERASPAWRLNASRRGQATSGRGARREGWRWRAAGRAWDDRRAGAEPGWSFRKSR
jgi:hypothetical protein